MFPLTEKMYFKQIFFNSHQNLCKFWPLHARVDFVTHCARVAPRYTAEERNILIIFVEEWCIFGILWLFLL